MLTGAVDVTVKLTVTDSVVGHTAGELEADTVGKGGCAGSEPPAHQVSSKGSSSDSGRVDSSSEQHNGRG